jgi:YD repeat-containing protein
VNYSYDDNGNLTARGSDSFAWDHENRMTSATVGGTTTTFAYNADGLRDSRTTGGNTVTLNRRRDFTVSLRIGSMTGLILHPYAPG